MRKQSTEPTLEPKMNANDLTVLRTLVLQTKVSTLARTLNVQPSTVSKWELGTRAIPGPAVAALNYMSLEAVKKQSKTRSKEDFPFYCFRQKWNDFVIGLSDEELVDISVGSADVAFSLSQCSFFLRYGPEFEWSIHEPSTWSGDLHEFSVDGEPASQLLEALAASLGCEPDELWQDQELLFSTDSLEKDAQFAGQAVAAWERNKMITGAATAFSMFRDAVDQRIDHASSEPDEDESDSPAQ